MDADRSVEELKKKDIDASRSRLKQWLSNIESDLGRTTVSRTAGIGYAYLVVDCSGSMAGDKLHQAEKGALNFAKDAVAKGYSVGLIQFHSSATHLCEPCKEISVLDQCVRKMQIGGSTHMAKAIHLAHQQLIDRVGTRVIVIVTDGMPNGPGDPTTSLDAGDKAKKDSIDIITIGTDDAVKAFLEKLASRPDLGIKVSREHFERGISSTVKNLPQLGAGQLTDDNETVL